MKQDHKLVASKQEYEVQYIATKFDVSNELVLQIMKDLGKDGKYCRSRRMIYAALKELGYTAESK